MDLRDTNKASARDNRGNGVDSREEGTIGPELGSPSYENMKAPMIFWRLCQG